MSLLDSVAEAVPVRLERIETAVLELFEPVEERPTTTDALRTTGRMCSLLVGLAALAGRAATPLSSRASVRRRTRWR